ncbi:MAG: winged helix-turn-helix domain-containing protein [Rhizobiaceae bacterium]
MKESGEYAAGGFYIGNCLVRPGENEMLADGHNVRLEPKVMRVLSMLAKTGGTVVSREKLLDDIWFDVACSDEVVTRAISHLRRAFRKLDNSQHYVKTISKRGYMLAHNVNWVDKPQSPGATFSDSVEAHRLYLQGKSLNARINGDTIIPVAKDLLSKALSLDPSFAEAHAEIAHSYTLMGTYIKGAAGPALLEKTIHHAQRAIDLKPSLAFPKVLLAIAEFTVGNVINAIELNENAVELEPNNAEAVMRLGYFYAAIGLTRKAIPFLEHAVALDPAQGRNLQVLALAKLNHGDLVEADALAERAIALHHYFAYDTHAAIAFARGDYEAGAQRMIAGYEWMNTMFDDRFDAAAWEKTCRMAVSPERETRLTLAQWLMALLGDFEHTPEVPLLQGLVRCGAADLLFEVMKDCLPLGRHGSYLSLWAATEPCRDIYYHPEFLTFAGRIGMRKAWEKFGWPDQLSQAGKIFW